MCQLACLVLLVASLGAAEPPPDILPAWIAITYHMPNQEYNNYIIGSLPRATLVQLEEGKFDKPMLKLEDLRYYDDEEDRYRPYEDEYDRGIILVPVKNLLLIEVHKGDPLKVERKKAKPPAEPGETRL